MDTASLNLKNLRYTIAGASQAHFYRNKFQNPLQENLIVEVWLLSTQPNL